MNTIDMSIAPDYSRRIEFHKLTLRMRRCPRVAIRIDHTTDPIWLIRGAAVTATTYLATANGHEEFVTLWRNAREFFTWLSGYRRSSMVKHIRFTPEASDLFEGCDGDPVIMTLRKQGIEVILARAEDRFYPLHVAPSTVLVDDLLRTTIEV